MDQRTKNDPHLLYRYVYISIAYLWLILGCIYVDRKYYSLEVYDDYAIIATQFPVWVLELAILILNMRMVKHAAVSNLVSFCVVFLIFLIPFLNNDYFCYIYSFECLPP